MVHDETVPRWGKFCKYVAIPVSLNSWGVEEEVCIRIDSQIAPRSSQSAKRKYSYIGQLHDELYNDDWFILERKGWSTHPDTRFKLEHIIL